MDFEALNTSEQAQSLTNSRKPAKRRGGCLMKLSNFIKKNLLLLITVAGVIMGFAIGFAVREGRPSKTALMWIGLPGQLYLRLLKMMIVPLICCIVICGTAALDPKSNGKISIISLVFVISTNALGSALGIGTAFIFAPGKGSVAKVDVAIEGNMQTQDILADLIRNIIPDNLLQATFSQTQTKYRQVENVIQRNTTNGTLLQDVVEVKKYLGTMNNPNIIGLIFACTLLGLAAAKLKGKGKPFLDLIQSVSDIVICVIKWFMWTTPLGVISLIAVSIASIDDVESMFAQLGLFIATVTVGISTQQLIVMPAIFLLFTRKNPFAFLLSIARPWMIAFAATSTAVAIPEMITACEDKNKIDKRVSRFVIPFSVTISCNGAAMYIAAATVFVSNLTGTTVTLGDALMIWLLVTVAVMAIPSVPSASIMTVIMVLTAMNIPGDDIALLLAVEWYLDRIRTTSSVVSHTFCAAVVYSLCKTDLKKLDEKLLNENEMSRTSTEVTVIHL